MEYLLQLLHFRDSDTFHHLFLSWHVQESEHIVVGLALPLALSSLTAAFALGVPFCKRAFNLPAPSCASLS